jgi:hypothetical protein
MGITDEDYANAIEHQRVHQIAISKLGLQKQQETLEEVVLKAQRAGARGIKTLNEQDLQHEAMKAPLSALVDMWVVRWGGEWVSEAEFREEDFWRLALIRLTGANKVEKHNLANQYDAVYRIIE